MPGKRGGALFFEIVHQVKGGFAGYMVFDAR
jgi:hypothetical protein